MKNPYAKRLHILELALMVGLAVFLASGALALQKGDQLAERMVRLHVLANSDSAEDQALKLLVRDQVLARTEALLRQTENRQEAAALLAAHLPELEQAAEETVRAGGYDYPVTVRLEETDFPTREYEGFALPAGRYLALRVLIGEAEGQNWWCVVFPPLCAAASVDLPAALASGLTEDQADLVSGEGYVLRFKAIEWWQSLREAVSPAAGEP